MFELKICPPVIYYLVNFHSNFGFSTLLYFCVRRRLAYGIETDRQAKSVIRSNRTAA